MDFSTKFTVRTDLADEVLENLEEKKGVPDDGITFNSESPEGIRVDTVEIKNSLAEQNSGKPIGKYITVETGEVWKMSREDFEKISKVIAGRISSMIPHGGLCLVVCLGNAKIISDAVGPFAAQNIIVSRHIKIKDPSLFERMELGECACIVPGVMGDTGAEALELVRGAVEKLKPSSVIVIDALASRNISRLVKTVQICDSGISPGSGVGNARHEISKRTLGVPTVAIGVPTVVEALTLSLDLLSRALCDERDVYSFVEQKLSGNMGRFFVCPKESDKIIRTVAKLIGYSVNLAVHNNISLFEIDEFLS